MVPAAASQVGSPAGGGARSSLAAGRREGEKLA